MPCFPSMKTACLYLLLLATTQLCSTSPAAPASHSIPQEHTLPETLNPTIQPHNDSTLVGVTPWPSGPYTLHLPSDYIFGIDGESYSDSPAPTTASIQRFLYEFSDNLESAYPPPSLSPLRARSTYYDLDSFTRYDLTADVLAIVGLRAPSATVGKALGKLAFEVGRHGAPQQLIGLISKHQRGLIPVRQYNLIRLVIQPLGEEGLRMGTSNQSGEFMATA